MSSESVLKKNHLVRQKEATLALKIVSTPLASLFFFFPSHFFTGRENLEEQVGISFQTVPQVSLNSTENIKACLSEVRSSQAEILTFSLLIWFTLTGQSSQDLFVGP